MQTHSFKLSVFFSPRFVRETEALEDNSSVNHIWAWHRQTGRDPLCIEGYSWLRLKEGKKNGVGGWGVGGETILWPRTSTYKHFRYQKSIRRDQNPSFPGAEEWPGITCDTSHQKLHFPSQRKTEHGWSVSCFSFHLRSAPLFRHFHCAFTHERKATC